jgi:hypothetical protein
MGLFSWAKNKVVSAFSWWFGIKRVTAEDLKIVKKYLPIINKDLKKPTTSAGMKKQVEKNVLKIFRMATKEELAKLLQILIYNSSVFEKNLVKYDKSFTKKSAKNFFHQIQKILADAVVNKISDLDDKNLQKKIIAALNTYEFEPLNNTEMQF